jgi:23S rRNA (uridine2552-2'-O)-methyltransferase
MSRQLHDHFFREARREGYVSRAAYKLIEIDDRRHLLRAGARVLDCGCAPGSWLQVAARRVGDHGVVVGIDRQPLKQPPAESHVHAMAGDIFAVDPATLRDLAGGQPFDVILSDMAPDTTGDRTIDHHASVRLCQRVLDLCPPLLRTGGSLVMKAFEGPDYRALLEQAGACFDRAKGVRPRASRSVSREMYIVAEGYRGGTGADETESQRPPDAPPPGGPVTGWG